MLSRNAIFTNHVGQFMHKVYAWMCMGLFATAVTSYSLFLMPQLLMAMLKNPIIFWGLLIAQLGLVLYLSAAINRLSYTTGAVMFFIYAALVGITLTPIFLKYTMTSIGITFGVTAGMFGSMALYGYFTKTDLSALGSILIMGLWGLIIAMLANWYFQSSQMDYIISCAGVVIFTLLTAYDVQRIKMMASHIEYDPSADMVEKTNKIALMGALMLYLDFLNLFLYLLRFMGRERN